MMNDEFTRVRRQIANYCMRHQLYAKWDKSEDSADIHFDFLLEVGAKATELQNLHVPDNIDVEGYVLVKLPSPQSMGPYWYDDYRHNEQRYSSVVDDLQTIASPDYLIGIENGYASHLLWTLNPRTKVNI